jgi:hypothetical protein
MYVVFRCSDDRSPDNETLLIYQAKRDLDSIRKSYETFKSSSNPTLFFLEELVNKGVVVIERVLTPSRAGLDPDDAEFFRKVQESRPLIIS